MDKEELTEKAIEETREEIKDSFSRDKFMVKAVNQLDELNNNLNEEMERFRDWYSLHFPELEKEIAEDEHLMKILSNGLERSQLDSFSEMAENSTGAAMTEEDRKMMKQVFDHIQQKNKLRQELESYIQNIAEQEMPNLETLLGPLLAARLVSLAGGLEELAKKPSSTVQMYGAEKALFRFLRGNGTPPKHGIIFEHSYVNKLPEDKRGKMARFLANKATIAAKLDQYGDKHKGEELREECRQKFEELNED
ncbi:MAG: NOP5/NOP56 family protein [Candidatus Nanohaloarchaea archaeon]